MRLVRFCLLDCLADCREIVSILDQERLETERAHARLYVFRERDIRIALD